MPIRIRSRHYVHEHVMNVVFSDAWRYQPEQPQQQATPLPELHWLVKRIAALRTKEDRGLGDTVARIFARFGGDHFKWTFEKLGINCGCDNRQAFLNELHSYR